MTSVATCTETEKVAAAIDTAYVKLSLSGARTIATHAFATSPVKLFVTQHSSGACWIFSATFGGGFVGGDKVRMRVDADPHTTALLTTQASTKVYRSVKPCSQTIACTVGEAALLAVLPDPLVCFAGADFSQHQRYDLERGANLLMVDWMTSGRHATGERWRFGRYRNRIEIVRDGRRIFYDGLALEHRPGAVARAMGQFEVLATCVISGPDVNDSGQRIVSTLSEQPIHRDADVIESACTLPDGGTLVRIAGTNVERVRRLIRDRLNFSVPRVGDDPWSRKW